MKKLFVVFVATALVPSLLASCDLSGMLGLRPKPPGPDEARITSFSLSPAHNPSLKKEYQGMIGANNINVHIPYGVATQGQKLLATITTNKGEVFPKDPQAIHLGATYTVRDGGNEKVYTVESLIDQTTATYLLLDRPFYVKDTKKIPIRSDYYISYLDDAIYLELTTQLLSEVGNNPVGFLRYQIPKGAKGDLSVLEDGGLPPYKISVTSQDGQFEEPHLIDVILTTSDITKIHAITATAQETMTTTKDLSGLSPPVDYFQQWRDGSSVMLNSINVMTGLLPEFRPWAFLLHQERLRNLFLTKLYWGEITYPLYAQANVHEYNIIPKTQYEYIGWGDWVSLRSLRIGGFPLVEISEGLPSTTRPQEFLKPIPREEPSGENYEKYKILKAIYDQTPKTRLETQILSFNSPSIENYNLAKPITTKDELIHETVTFSISYGIQENFFAQNGNIHPQIYNGFFEDPYEVKGKIVYNDKSQGDYYNFKDITLTLSDRALVENIVLGEGVYKPIVSRDSLKFSFHAPKKEGFVASFDLIDSFTQEKQNHIVTIQNEPNQPKD